MEGSPIAVWATLHRKIKSKRQSNAMASAGGAKHWFKRSRYRCARMCLRGAPRPVCECARARVCVCVCACARVCVCAYACVEITSLNSLRMKTRVIFWYIRFGAATSSCFLVFSCLLQRLLHAKTTSYATWLEGHFSKAVSRQWLVQLLRVGQQSASSARSRACLESRARQEQGSVGSSCRCSLSPLQAP